MLGAIAGDIIGSPYVRNDADGMNFEMFSSVRGWKDGGEVTFHPRVTDKSVMTLAVARWLLNDHDHKKGTFVSIMQEMYDRYPESGFSPTMKIWCRSEYARPFTRDCNDPVARISPLGLFMSDLKEAIDAAGVLAGFTHDNPDSIRGAQALTEAIWLASHGRSKEDIRFSMEHDYQLDLSIDQKDISSLLKGGVREDIMVNGEPTGEYYYRESGRIDYSTTNTLTAALKVFMDGEGFEDVVRRAVSLGGNTNTVASMAGALAQAFYKEIPEHIVRECSRIMPNDLKDIMESFENRISRKPVQEVTKKVAQEDSLSFQVIKCPDGKKIFVADPHRKDLIEALKARFGEGITIIRPRMLAETYRNLSAQGKDGTYLERPRPDVRTLYFQNGEFRTSVTLEGETLPDRQARMSSRQQFCEISEFARSVKAELQEQVGYVGEGSIHFQNAYYPVIHHDKVEIFKGDIFAGSVGIDPRNGLLRIDKGGDFGPMEWFGDRTESVFNSVSIDSIKDAIGRFCLDEGIGIHDKDRKLNLEVANNDVANSKDKTLIDSLVMNTEDIRPRMRMSL